MRVLKSLVVVIGATASGASAVFLLEACAGPVRNMDALGPVVIVVTVAVLTAAIGGAVATAYIVWRTSRRKRGHITPDAQKEARAKFTPSSPTIVEDPPPARRRDYQVTHRRRLAGPRCRVAGLTKGTGSYREYPASCRAIALQQVNGGPDIATLSAKREVT